MVCIWWNYVLVFFFWEVFLIDVRGRVWSCECRATWVWLKLHIVQILVIVAFFNRVVQGRCFLCEIGFRRVIVFFIVFWFCNYQCWKGRPRFRLGLWMEVWQSSLFWIVNLEWNLVTRRSCKVLCIFFYITESTPGKPNEKQNKNTTIRNWNPTQRNHHTQIPQQGKSANKVCNFGTRTGLTQT